MSNERRPGIPNEEPEEKKGRLEEIREEGNREHKRRYRPVRLFVTSSEREHLTPPSDDQVWEFFAALVITAVTKPNLVRKFRDHMKQTLEDAKTIDQGHAQFTPLTSEEVEAQDVDGVISLLKTQRTMSGKINLVENLNPEQLDTLRQRDPDFEMVMTGLTKRPARKEKAQQRLLDIYRRRGEDGRRP